MHSLPYTNTLDNIIAIIETHEDKWIKCRQTFTQNGFEIKQNTFLAIFTLTYLSCYVLIRFSESGTQVLACLQYFLFLSSHLTKFWAG